MQLFLENVMLVGISVRDNPLIFSFVDDPLKMHTESWSRSKKSLRDGNPCVHLFDDLKLTMVYVKNVASKCQQRIHFIGC